MKQMKNLGGALCLVLALWGVAQAATTTTVTLVWTYGATDATHQPATSTVVQYRTDGGSWGSYCGATAPTATCTGAALQINHNYDFKSTMSNSFGSSADSGISSLAAYAPNTSSVLTITHIEQ